MTNSQYTSLPLSKLIAERLPELETSVSHVKFYGYWEMLAIFRDGEWVQLDSSWDYEASLKPPKVEWKTPAYTFTDLLRAIQMLGEKEGWDMNSSEFSVGCIFFTSLLRAYIDDNLTIDKNTEKYLTSLFTNHD